MCTPGCVEIWCTLVHNPEWITRLRRVCPYSSLLYGTTVLQWEQLGSRCQASKVPLRNEPIMPAIGFEGRGWSEAPCSAGTGSSLGVRWVVGAPERDVGMLYRGMGPRGRMLTLEGDSDSASKAHGRYSNKLHWGVSCKSSQKYSVTVGLHWWSFSLCVMVRLRGF